MCFQSFTPRLPKLAAVPTAPTIDDAAVRARQQLEAEKLQGRGGTAETVKTDLVPSIIFGQQAQKRVMLGV